MSNERYYKRTPFLKGFVYLTIDLTWFVLAILLYTKGNSEYIQVIQYETAEWGVGAIEDISAVTSGKVCPPDFTMVSGYFSGTENYCPTFTIFGGPDYKKGTCPGKYDFSTIAGFKPAPLRYFDGVSFCIKRNQGLNYHTLSLLRSIDQAMACP
jgi:hypothetical protein